MTRRASILFCLAVQAFFTMAFPAEALAAPVATTLSNVQRAERYWGVPCPGVHVEWVDLPEGIAGEGTLDGCAIGEPTIWLSTDIVPGSRGWICTVVVHEYGHLIGLGHSLDKHSPMHSPITHIVKGC